ncbi:MAG: 2-succinyl-5-enolpyruvyl-6-hydroxy-3-cyclohexene-1-carboxylic-acid synthase [Ilumatobacteraceae bacterium]
MTAPDPAPADAQATFCAALVRRWADLGAQHAVIAPGSRSTPIALAIVAEPRLTVHVVHDERVAAFVALGIGLATGVPALLLCTSGTAATHFHAAVVEADLAGVPMLVLTADRPPELHGVGAAQTIDQARLFGPAPRWFHDPGVADLAVASSWTGLAERAWSAAAGGIDPGPVHLNLPMREPLVGTVLPAVLATAPPAERTSPGFSSRLDRTLSGRGATRTGSPAPALALPADAALDDLAGALSGRLGVIVSGRNGGRPADAAEVGALATALGWPVLAEPRAGCRHLPGAVGAFDAIVRAAGFADHRRPEVVLRLGEPPASKALAQWLAASGTVQVQVDGSTRRFDPDHLVRRHVSAPVGALCTALARRVASAPAEWAADWLAAEHRAQQALDAALGDELSEPAVSRVLTSGALPSGAHLVVASSMPVRDVEWYGGPAVGVTVHANRGANGIDGVLSTAIGVAAATGAPTVCLLGDVALCHDASALTGLARRNLDLTIVVVDNDGGAIFSFLVQHDQLDATRFEQLFGTPHGTDLIALARAHGLPAATVTTPDELHAAVGRRGVQMVRVASDRESNLAVHQALNAAVAAALA